MSNAMLSRMTKQAVVGSCSRRSNLLAVRTISIAIPNQWSGEFSFATPETDFCRTSWRDYSSPTTVSWSESLSFSSPESDFTARANTAVHLTNANNNNNDWSNNEWSGNVSFASPETDFTARANTAVHLEEANNDWSNQLSFASPETDFTARFNTAVHLEEANNEWSSQLSFTSPETDFTARSNTAIHLEEANNEWSNRLSYTSPETDFTARSNPAIHLQEDQVPQQAEWSGHYTFASPESDFASWSLPRQQNEHHQYDEPSTIYSMSFASPETAVGAIPVTEMLDPRMVAQLLQSERQLMSTNKNDLPLTLQEAMSDPMDARAIVITKVEAPFEIVDVNNAWVGLCGYSKDESRHQTLSKLLQGPETDRTAIHQVVAQLLAGEQASTVVTNYTKSGRKFQNRVRMGPLYDSHDQITHFVGILQEVQMEA